MNSTFVGLLFLSALVVVLAKKINRAPRLKTGFNDSSVVVNTGDLVHLSCPIIGGPKPSITWTRDNQTLSMKSLRTHNGSGIRSRQLVIRNVQLSDAGPYTCVAVNRFGTLHVTMHLNVLASEVRQQRFDNSSSETFTTSVQSLSKNIPDNFTFIRQMPDQHGVVLPFVILIVWVSIPSLVLIVASTVQFVFKRCSILTANPRKSNPEQTNSNSAPGKIIIPCTPGSSVMAPGIPPQVASTVSDVARDQEQPQLDVTEPPLFVTTRKQRVWTDCQEQPQLDVAIPPLFVTTRKQRVWTGLQEQPQLDNDVPSPFVTTRKQRVCTGFQEQFQLDIALPPPFVTTRKQRVWTGFQEQPQPDNHVPPQFVTPRKQRVWIGFQEQPQLDNDVFHPFVTRK